MIVRELEVLNELGFHSRVACRITRSAGEFQSSVHVKKNGQSFDLNAKHGDVVTVEIEGPDEEAAAAAMEKLFAEKFGER